MKISKALLNGGLILVLSLAFVPFAWGGCYDNEVLADNPIAYWRFEETSGTTAADSADSNDGTYNNVLLNQPSAFLALGNSAGFNGATASVSVPSLGSVNNLTIEVWIRAGSFAPPGNWAGLYMSNSFSTNESHWQLRNNRFEWAISGQANSLSAFTFNLDTWYHIVTTFNQSTLRGDLYINGQHQEQLFVANGGTQPSLPAAHIGSLGGGSRLFDGLIDEVAIYNTVLSAERIAAHYSAGKCEEVPTGTCAVKIFGESFTKRQLGGSLHEQFILHQRISLAASQQSFRMGHQWSSK